MYPSLVVNVVTTWRASNAAPERAPPRRRRAAPAESWANLDESEDLPQRAGQRGSVANGVGDPGSAMRHDEAGDCDAQERNEPGDQPDLGDVLGPLRPARNRHGDEQ